MGKLLVERWKVFRKCKKDNFSTIANDGDLISICLGPPQPDPSAKITKRVTKLNDDVLKCIDKGVTPVGPNFPGDCTSALDGAFTDCVSERASCRFCLAINIAEVIETCKLTALFGLYPDGKAAVRSFAEG